MGEDHCLDIADSFGNDAGDEGADCRDDRGSEKYGAQIIFSDGKLSFKETGDPRAVNALIVIENRIFGRLQRCKAGPERVERKQNGQFDKYAATFLTNRRKNGLLRAVLTALGTVRKRMTICE
jgi:hypothetical protein